MCQVLIRVIHTSCLVHVRAGGSAVLQHTGYLPCWLLSEPTFVNSRQSAEAAALFLEGCAKVVLSTGPRNLRALPSF